MRRSQYEQMFSALPPIVLQKSFCSTGLKFCGPYARRSNNNVGGYPPRAKLTGDSGNAFEAALICDLRSFRTLAENQPLCLLGLLQHYPADSGHSWAGPLKALGEVRGRLLSLGRRKIRTLSKLERKLLRSPFGFQNYTKTVKYEALEKNVVSNRKSPSLRQSLVRSFT
jgi:hypothetical protein